jgi:tartrate dehydrogenase/decarboxylase/D-malate dehydrogenase
MTRYRVAVIPGDGIGNEVTPAAMRVLDAAAARGGVHFDWESFPWGSEYYFEHGRMMPADALDVLRPFHAIFFGAVGHPRVQDNVTLNGLLLPIRRGFDQYACVRPAVLYDGVRSALAGRVPGDIDLVVVRENTEGEYAQIGGIVHASSHEGAVQSAVFTRHGTERVIRFAFDLARKRGRKRLLTSVTKSNAQGFSMAFWDRVFADVAKEYADIRTDSLLVDAACMDLVRRPETFDVLVGSNLFGDILTDLSAAITGASLGLAPSANLNPTRAFPSMFEPVHGSAPDIAGRGISNPMAQMLSGVQMLEFLGEAAAASLVEKAVIAVLSDQKVLTADLGGVATTAAVGEAVTARVRDLPL